MKRPMRATTITAAGAALAVRAAAVTGAYAAAAAAVLATVILLRGLIDASRFQAVLGFMFIATLCAGLEPGTVKAHALARTGEAGDAPVALPACLIAGAIKALCAAPVLALVWRLADPAVGPWALGWTPLVAVAGFWATDLRARLDLDGRHAAAIALKQGSLAGGIALMGALVALRVPLSWAIGVSTLARLAPVAALAWRAPAGRDPRGAGGAWREAWRLLGEARWAELAAASAIAAAGGSADRVFGLRYLSPAAYGGYFLVYEALSKFWLIPYVLSPILFARRAAGAGDGSGLAPRGASSDAFVRGAWAFTALAGLAYLAGTAGALWLAPGLVRRVLGPPLGAAPLAFAAAVVIGAFTQLRLAQIQGAGAARWAAVVVGLGAILSIALFQVAARRYGAPGLLIAWLIKSAAEFALTLAAPALPPGARPSQDGPKTRRQRAPKGESRWTPFR